MEQYGTHLKSSGMTDAKNSSSYVMVVAMSNHGKIRSYSSVCRVPRMLFLVV